MGSMGRRYRGSIGNSFMLHVLIALLYIPVLLILAWYNAVLIRKGKRIYHFWNGVLHCAVAVGVWLLDDWKSGIAVLPITNLVFNTALNLLRGLPVDYTSPEVKQYTGLWMAWQKGKVVDYIEYKVFLGSRIAAMIFYATLIIVLLIL